MSKYWMSKCGSKFTNLNESKYVWHNIRLVKLFLKSLIRPGKPDKPPVPLGTNNKRL